MAAVCGIDEAGRGPVLGPLVLAGAMIDDTQISRLQNIGVKDSKLLSPLQRERLFDQIIKIVSSYEILQVPPAIIDAYVLSPEQNNNLNWLEATKSAEIINKLQPETAVVDCPSNNITAYSRYLRDKLINKKIHLVCEHKADVTYTICSAASILAKVTRDREVEKLKWEVGIDFGSLPYSEKVLIKYHGHIALKKIGEVIEEGLTDSSVFSLNPKNYKIELHPITRFIEHPKTKIFRLFLECGKFVDLSKNHPLFVLNDAGEIISKEMKDIQKGEFICLAGNIPSHGNLSKISLLPFLSGQSHLRSPILVEGALINVIFNRNNVKEIQKRLKENGYSRTSVYHWKKAQTLPLPVFLNFITKKDALNSCYLRSNKGHARIPVLLPLDREFLWFLGMYVAEGSLGKDKVVITSMSNIVFKRVKKIGEKFGIYVYRENCNIGLPSIILTKIIKGLKLGAYAREKSAPQFLFSCKKNIIASFLEGLYEGDGYEKDGSLEIETYSEILAQQIQWLHLFLGQFTAYRKRKNRDGRIIHILAKNSNSLSPDNLPSIIGKYIKKIRLEKGISITDMARQTSIDASHLIRIETQKVQCVQKKSISKIARVLGYPPLLMKLLNAHLCWLQVKEIKDVHKKEKVYDFEVQPNGEKIENFLGGSCGIILHNSGYMTDPKTVAFLEQYWDKFDFFRKSWASWQQYAKMKNQKKLGEW